MSNNGTIVELTGKAWARGADGKIRALTVGDRLLPTDTIILAAGTVMQVAAGTGPDAAVVTYESPEAGTPAIVAPGKDTAAPTTPELLRMLQQDLANQGKKSKPADLEERSGDGHRFVELVRIGETVEADALTPLTLARITETIDPLALEWGHPDFAHAPWPHGLGHDNTRARNQTPVGMPDTVTSAEDEVVRGNVLGNDSDPEHRPLKVTGFEVDGVPYLPGQTADIPGKGTITINPDGSYIFVPVPDWHGSVPPITYTVTDGQQGGTTTSTLIIEITPVVDITPDEDRTHSGVPVTVPVLNNDTFENPDAKVTGVTNGTHGTVTINPDGTVTYTPNPGYVGDDTFTYTVTSGGVTETTTVTIHIENQPPALVPDTKVTQEDRPVSGNVLDNDSDPDGDPLTVTEFTVPGLGPIPVGPDGGTATIPDIGTITIHPNGDYTFTPVPDWNGTVPTISYTVSDGNDGGTTTSTLMITVTPEVDIVPEEVETHAGDPITIPVLDNDTFEDPDRKVTGVEDGSHGTVTFDPKTGEVTYTPNPGYVGEDTFTYTVTSGGVTETTTVTVNVTNTPPVAQPDLASGPEDEPVIGNLISGGDEPDDEDSDADGDPLTITEFTVEGLPDPIPVGPDGGTATIPDIGTITIHPNGDYTFTPVPDWNGTVPTITYTVSDGNDDGTDTSTLIITVDPVNDAPITVEDLPDQAHVDATSGIDIDVTSGFADVDVGDTLTYTATGLPEGLSISEAGVITGTIDNSASQGGEKGVYTVVVTATDEHKATVTQTFEWTVTNPGPVATADTGTTNEDTVLTVTAGAGVLANDSDPDGDALTVSKVGGNTSGVGAAVEGSAGGLFTVNENGSYSFDPNGAFDDLEAGATRTSSVTYEVNDGEGGTNTATLTITVTGVNDAPIARPDTGSVDEDGAALVVTEADGVIKSGGVATSLDSDVDGDTLTVTHVATSNTFPVTENAGTQITGQYGTLKLNADGSYTYTVNNDNAAVNALKDGAQLSDVFYYQISDGHGGTANSTLTITINGHTDGAPAIVPVDGNAAAEGQATVYESGLTSNAPNGESKTATGTITVTAPDGLTSITVGTTVLTLADLADLPTSPATVIDTPLGRLELTGYTPGSMADGSYTHGTLSYTYVLETPADNVAPTGLDSTTESIALTVTDINGVESTGSLVIKIVDDAPSVGTPDTVTVDEANLPNGLAPKGAALEQSGSLHIRTGADTTGFDTKLEADQTALKALGLTSGGVELFYNVSLDGHTLTATAGDGGPTVFKVTITNPGTAAAGYTFTLSGTLDHTGGIDKTLPFAFTATDHDADSANGSFSVVVKDDVPDAVDQPPISLAEGGDIVGSGIGDGVNLLGNDKTGADGGANTVTAITYTNEAGESVTVNVPAGETGITVDTRYGSLTVRADGTWSYTSDATENNLNGVSDNFSYTITDSDGSSDTAVQPLTVTDTTPTLSDVTLAVDEEGITGGSNPETSVSDTHVLGIIKGMDAIADVKFTTATVTGLDEENLTSGGVDLIYTLSLDGHTLTATAGVGGPTVFTLTLNNPTDAAGTTQSVTMELVGKLDHALANDENNLAIPVGYTVSDTDSSVNGTLTINVKDDVPTVANGATVSVVEGGVIVTGNFLTNDTQGADGAKVYQIVYVDETGTSQTGTVAALGSTFNTIHGSLTVQQNGNWSYTSDSATGNGAAVTHTKATNDTSIADVFSYNVIDGDGDVSGLASQTVTVTDTVPTIGIADTASVNEANLATGTDPKVAGLTTSGTLAVTKAADGIDVTFGAQQELEALNLKSGGEELHYTVSDDGHTLTATAGPTGPTVFTATITNPTASTAGYTFELSLPLDHSSADTIGLPIAYGVVDADGDTATGTVTVTVVDDKPATTQAVTVVEDSTGGVTFNTSADGNQTNVTIGTDANAPAHGTVSVGTDGKLTYIPNANYSGTDTFTYTTGGENGSPITTTVTVTVTPVSDAPTLTVDNTSVQTNEDTAVALGLNAPVVTDATDQNGAGAGDNPERLGAITLNGLLEGAVLIFGAQTHKITAAEAQNGITVQLTGGSPHLTGLITTLTMSVTDFEAMQVRPPAESHQNFTVNVGVYSFEVGDDGKQLAGVNGAQTPRSVEVEVKAVTDPVDLRPADGTDVSTITHTVAEDTPFNLKSLLSVNFPNSDGNITADIDGSELRWFEITGLPVGTTVTLDGGVVLTVNDEGVLVDSLGDVAKIPAPDLSTSATGLPDMTITPPHNFGGDAVVTVTLKAQDQDGDDPASTGAIVSDAVTLTLHVTPVAGDVKAGDVTTAEDTPVAFLQHVAVTDTDGSEKITVVSFDVPTGWKLIVPSGTGFTVSEEGVNPRTITFDNTLTEADRESVLDGFLIKPPAHSSADATITVNVTTVDISGTLTDTATKPLSVKVTVTPVAEVVNTGAAGDSDGDGTRDVTMAGSHVYVAAGAEDTWFNMNADASSDPDPDVDPGYSVASGWTNQDTDEQVFAHLTPILSVGSDGDSVIGSQFRWSTDGGTTWQYATYTGTPIDVPVEYLGTLQFMAAPNVSGTFTIKMETLTIDTDPNTGDTVETVSGLATLTNLVINPVADDVMLALNARVTGKEDTEIPLKITPTSSDPSETFNVTISGIPVGATITYGGVVQTVTGGVVTIENFDATKPMSIMPPENSNVGFTLGVSAVSVDGTSTSEPTDLTIAVTVKGVADSVDFVSKTTQYTEADLDGGAKVRLSDMVAVDPAKGDHDGSETLSYRISGLPAGFSLSQGSLLSDATGTARVWVLTQEQFENVVINTPANFSGEQNFTITTVTTENDGDSLTSDAFTLTLAVEASVEATTTSSFTLTEDVLESIGFAIQHQNANDNGQDPANPLPKDTDETLGHVWIKVSDATGDNFDLYLGTTKLAAIIGLPTRFFGGVEYYELTSAQASTLAAKGGANLGGDLGSFTFKYEIIDDHFGSISSGDLGETLIKDGSFNLFAKPVSDPIEIRVTEIRAELASTNAEDNHPDGHDDPDTAILHAADDVTILLNISSADYDGSEKVLRVVIDGVPEGVTVKGGEYVGEGRWLLILDDDKSLPINEAGGISLSVVFHVGNAMGGLTNVPITMEVQSQDGANADIVKDQVTWYLTTDFDADPGIDPPIIAEWEYTDVHVGEDTWFSLDKIVTGKVTNVDDTIENTLTITLTNVPPGTRIEGMIATTVDGHTVWTASVVVEPGDDVDEALKALMEGITVVAPLNSNDNNSPGGFAFDATLTISTPDSKPVTGKIDAADMVVPVDPVSDQAMISITAGSIDEGGNSIPVTVTVLNPADGTFGTIVGGKVYILVESAQGLAGGTLTHSGQPLETEDRDGVTYYVMENVAYGETIDLVYTPPLNLPGKVTFAAEVYTQEETSSVIQKADEDVTADVRVVNNGVTVSNTASSGTEGGKIEITGLVVTLKDADGSEKVNTILLSNVPNGFLVYAGADAGTATMVANAGGTGSSNTWVISYPDGAIPPYVGILPPAHWSGTLTDLQLIVESGEQTFTDKKIENFDLADVTVTPVADGVTITPGNSFGKENAILGLNLNASMKDPVNVDNNDAHSETATIKLTGLGEFASFFVGAAQITTGITYANGVYTIAGLTQDELTQLGFKQASAALVDQDTNKAGVQIGVEIFTVDGSSTSASQTGTVTVNSQAQTATTGDDHLLWTGSAINAGAGTDTVELRAGEVLSGATLDAKLASVEVLELHGNTISSLSVGDVLGISSAPAGLTINGGASDHLTLGAEWTISGSGPVNGYDIYTALSGATQIELRVEHTIHID